MKHMRFRWPAVVISGTLSIAAAAAVTFDSDSKAIRLANDRIALEFSADSGALLKIENRATMDQYLKRTPAGGNPYRLFVNPTRLPVDANPGWVAASGAVEDDLGSSQVIDAGVTRLQSADFEAFADSGIVTMRSCADNLEFTVTVTLNDGSEYCDVGLTVTNTGEEAVKLMAGFPFLTGLQLGETPEDDLGLRTFFSGIADEAAWVNSGGAYGQQCSIQFQCVYDKKHREGFAVFPMDHELRAKILRRLPNGGISVIYYPAFELAGKESWEAPAARLVIHSGNWKRALRFYRDWFASAFGTRPLPERGRMMTMYHSLWVPHPADAGKPGSSSFVDIIERNYLNTKVDLFEWAMYWEGMRIHPESYGAFGPDAEYQPRLDLGGAAALRQAVAELHRIGRMAGLYVAGVGVHQSSEWFQQHGTDGVLFTADAQPSHHEEDYFMCPGYEPWQQQVATVCARLVRKFDIDYIRLDEMGQPKPCFNPAHGHASPYDFLQWEREYFRKVRAAIDQVNPDVLLYTEFPIDFYHITNNGYLQMNYGGREPGVFRILFPHYQAASYHSGALESALDGYIAPEGGGAGRSDFVFVSAPSGVPSAPEGYPTGQGRYPGAVLRQEELAATFQELYYDGELSEAAPFAPDVPDWVGRLWVGKRWALGVGARSNLKPLGQPAEVIYPELPDEVVGAWEIDLRTGQLRPVELQRQPDGAHLRLQADFAALFFPYADTPDWVTVSAPESGKAGETMQLALQLPCREVDSAMPVTAIAEVPGILPPQEITLPRTLEIPVPADTRPGWYALQLRGDAILPAKKWLLITRYTR